MRFSICALRVALTVLASVVVTRAAGAEDFFPVGGGYECVRYANGNEFLISAHNPDYNFVNAKDVTKQLVQERALLRKRETDLKAISKAFQAPKRNTSISSKFERLFSAIFYGLAGSQIPEDVTQEERKSIVSQLKQLIGDRKVAIANLLKGINECNAGQIAPPKGGDYVIPEVRLVGFKGAPVAESYAGFMLITSARPNKFSKKPTGFNGCLKLYFKDGSISGLYTGFGTEPCLGTPGIFEFATAACNATVGKNQVGYPIQKAQGVGTSDEVLSNLLSLASADKPQAVILALPVTLSRDKSVAICDRFVNG